MSVPAQPKIYHIVRVDNLASIVADGRLWSDSLMLPRQGGTVIGMNAIKQRRLGLPVSCHEALTVGQCVPFYFCSRSSCSMLSTWPTVGDLVEGFETPFGLELLATVHWVVTREGAQGADEAAAKVHAWNDRKKRFSRRRVGIAYETLRAKGWLAD